MVTAPLRPAATVPGRPSAQRREYGLSAIGPGLRLYKFAPGETVETVRRLQPRATAQPLEGRVLDERGEPVSDATVILRSNVVRGGMR